LLPGMMCFLFRLTNARSPATRASLTLARLTLRVPCDLVCSVSHRGIVKAREALFLAADGGIALAGHFREPRAVQHHDAAAAVIDDAEPLQLLRRHRHAFAAHAEIAGNALLGGENAAARNAVQHLQQPAAQLLLHGVMLVAGRALRDL